MTGVFFIPPPIGLTVRRGHFIDIGLHASNFNSALRRRVFSQLLLALYWLAAIVAISWYAFTEKGLLIDPVFPTMLALAIFLFTTILRLLQFRNVKRDLCDLLSSTIWRLTYCKNWKKARRA